MKQATKTKEIAISRAENNGIYNLGVETAGALFSELTAQKILTPKSKRAFNWFFGDQESKTGQRPTAIVWKGSAAGFALFGLLVTLEYYGGDTLINWRYLTSIFVPADGEKWDILKLGYYSGKIQCWGDMPKDIVIGSLTKGSEILNEIRELINKEQSK